MARPVLIHDADQWRRFAAQVRVASAGFADAATAVADVDLNTQLGSDRGGRRACRSATGLQSDVVMLLRHTSTALSAYAEAVAIGSTRIVDADGQRAPADTRTRRSIETKHGVPVRFPTQPGRLAEPPAVVTELAPELWPGADVASLRCLAGSARTAATILAAVLPNVVCSPSEHAGQADAAATARRRALRSMVDDATGALLTFGSAADHYATAAASTQDEMRTIAARVELERSRAGALTLLGAGPVVEPATVGRLALDASAQDYRARLDDVGRRHGDQLSGSSGVAATGGLVAGVGAAVVGGSVAVGRPRPRRRASARVDAVGLARRVAEFAAAVVGWPGVVISVGMAAASTGESVTIVATSDDHDYVRPGVVLADGDWFAGRGGAPESTLLDVCAELHVDLVAVASTAPTPEPITTELTARGVRVLTRFHSGRVPLAQ